MPDQSSAFRNYIHFFNELKSLYDQMDQRYDAVAGAYGFQCSGCTDNCCLTRFFHHTLIEFFYLRKGFADLDEDIQTKIRSQAIEVNEKVQQAEKNGKTPRIMCPLNADGRCFLYTYRPMICRLHGIPHEFRHPARGRVPGPGCHEFEANCGDHSYIEFNRTPFYQQMAQLERQVREASGITDRFKKTVAQMLADDLEKMI